MASKPLEKDRGTQLKGMGGWSQHDKMGTQKKQISRIPKFTMPWVEQCRPKHVSRKL